MFKFKFGYFPVLSGTFLIILVAEDLFLILVHMHADESLRTLRTRLSVHEHERFLGVQSSSTL